MNEKAALKIIKDLYICSINISERTVQHYNSIAFFINFCPTFMNAIAEEYGYMYPSRHEILGVLEIDQTPVLRLLVDKEQTSHIVLYRHIIQKVCREYFTKTPVFINKSVIVHNKCFI